LRPLRQAGNSRPHRLREWQLTVAPLPHCPKVLPHRSSRAVVEDILRSQGCGGHTDGRGPTLKQTLAKGCQLLALLGPREMSDLSPQSETKRTLIRSLSPTSRFYEYAPQTV